MHALALVLVLHFVRFPDSQAFMGGTESKFEDLCTQGSQEKMRTMKGLLRLQGVPTFGFFPSCGSIADMKLWVICARFASNAGSPSTQAWGFGK